MQHRILNTALSCTLQFCWAWARALTDASLMASDNGLYHVTEMEIVAALLTAQFGEAKVDPEQELVLLQVHAGCMVALVARTPA